MGSALFPHLSQRDRRRFVAAGMRQGWFQRSEPLVVALSGGGDSMALLLLLLATVPLARLVLAHAEHGLRGEASREDARFVQEMGSRFHLDTATGFLEVREHRRPGEGIEECARRLRLQFLQLGGPFGTGRGKTRHCGDSIGRKSRVRDPGS